MKTLILTAALVVSTTLSFSQESFVLPSNEFAKNTEDVSVAMYPNSADAITLILAKSSESVVKLRVKSESDRVLYQKRFKKADNARIKYDISEFPSGEYTFELIKGKDVLYSQKFSKKEGTVAIAN